MSRCDAVLRAYAEDQARAAGATSRWASSFLPLRLPNVKRRIVEFRQCAPYCSIEWLLSALGHFAVYSMPSRVACSIAAAGPGRSRLDEVLCILEVLASMSLAPAVADAALPPGEFLTQVRQTRPC